MINQNVKNAIDNAIFEKSSQGFTGRLGTIMSYDPYDNTATVLLSKQQTDEIDSESLIRKVMCPRMLGVQTVAPTPGTLCWISFKDNNITQPLITQYYNHRYSQYDYPKQSKALNAIPSYLLGL